MSGKLTCGNLTCGEPVGWCSAQRSCVSSLPNKPTHLHTALAQMLFFGYKLNGNPPRMDNGFTEHCGCPVYGGHKWIATQWYREGMTAERGWEWHRDAEQINRW